MRKLLLLLVVCTGCITSSPQHIGGGRYVQSSQTQFDRRNIVVGITIICGIDFYKYNKNDKSKAKTKQP